MGGRLPCAPPRGDPECSGPAANSLGEAARASPSKGQEVEWTQLFLQVLVSRKVKEPEPSFRGKLSSTAPPVTGAGPGPPKPLLPVASPP